MPHRQQAVGKSDEWYTPPHIFEALDVMFDTDVASPGHAVTPWIPAKTFITANSLEVPWHGRVWIPPFGKRGDKAFWLQKFFEHGDGIALVPDRTSAPWWQLFAPRADLVLFVTPKIKFISPNPNQSGNWPAQGTCLLSIGERSNVALCTAEAQGLGTIMQPY